MDILLTIILDYLLFTLPLWIWIRKSNETEDLGGAIFVVLGLGNLIYLIIGIAMGLFGYAINIPVCIVFCIINVFVVVDKKKHK